MLNFTTVRGLRRLSSSLSCPLICLFSLPFNHLFMCVSPLLHHTLWGMCLSHLLVQQLLNFVSMLDTISPIFRGFSQLRHATQWVSNVLMNLLCSLFRTFSNTWIIHLYCIHIPFVRRSVLQIYPKNPNANLFLYIRK